MLLESCLVPLRELSQLGLAAPCLPSIVRIPPLGPETRHHNCLVRIVLLAEIRQQFEDLYRTKGIPCEQVWCAFSAAVPSELRLVLGMLYNAAQRFQKLWIFSRMTCAVRRRP